MRRACALTMLASLWPSIAMAGERTICAHPFAGASCLQTFSLVSISYVVIAGAYACGALVILAPRFASKRSWWSWMAGCLPFCYAITIASFTLGGALGWLTYPHDASPFFYIDWFVVACVLLATSAYVGLASRQGISASPVPA